MQNTLTTTILVPLIIGISLIAIYIEKNSKQHHLRKNGERVEGIIFDFSDREFYSSDSSNIPYPVIRFVTHTGEWITETYTFTHSGLKAGDKVVVYYDRANPRDFYVQLSNINALLPAMLVAGIAFAGYGLYALVEYLIS